MQLSLSNMQVERKEKTVGSLLSLEAPGGSVMRVSVAVVNGPGGKDSALGTAGTASSV